jgi:hypothetical protein
MGATPSETSATESALTTASPMPIGSRTAQRQKYKDAGLRQANIRIEK